ncbi:MAG: hypothetical protein JWQ00_607 [Noviherbaspirillum sp.]|nr:hypothetical protein [Noviherbaspirillum sp.]
MNGMRALASGLALVCWTAGACAGTASAQFSVGIVMRAMRDGVCVSRALSHAAGAIVKVDCDSNQFVSIEPDPARPFLGSMSRSRRTWFGVAPAPIPTERLTGPEHMSSLAIAPRLVRVTYEAVVAMEVSALTLTGLLTPSAAFYYDMFGSRLDTELPAGGTPAETRMEMPVQMLIGF